MTGEGTCVAQTHTHTSHTEQQHMCSISILYIIHVLYIYCTYMYSSCFFNILVECTTLLQASAAAWNVRAYMIYVHCEITNIVFRITQNITVWRQLELTRSARPLRLLTITH